MGFATAIVGVVGTLASHGIIDPMWIGIVSTVASAFGFRVNDKQKAVTK